MKPVFEVEEVPGVLDTSKPVPDWVKPETTPRTGIVELIRLTNDEIGHDIFTGFLTKARHEIAQEVGCAVIERISDGRNYAVKSVRTEDFCREEPGYRITLTATILLRHWQDAQIGEDVVDDINLRGCIGDYWDAGNPAGDKLRFQRITADGRTLCWRRVA